MNTNRKKILLYLLLTLFLTMACASYSISGVERYSGDVRCVSKGYNPFEGTTTYRCYCPEDPSFTNEKYDIISEDFADPDRIIIKACDSYYLRNPVIPPIQGILPTEEPTEEPAPTEPPTDPAPLNPYLTGAFTTCDNAAGYVNFSIAENAPAYDPATFKVTFNGYPVSCQPAANNPSIFTCNYPPPSYAPPAGVQVFIGEELVNEFDFNGGAICDSAPQPKPNSTEEPQPEEPVSTEAPVDSGSD